MSEEPEVEQLQALKRALQLASGYKLLLAHANLDETRRRITQSLQADHHAVAIRLSNSDESLLDTLGRAVDRAPEAAAMVVMGLEPLLPLDDPGVAASNLGTLNATRDALRSRVGRPLILWVSDYTLTALGRKAPDLLSTRSGLYTFAGSAQEVRAQREQLADLDESALTNLTHPEKEERATLLESALRQCDDAGARCSLALRLGHLYNHLGRYDAAVDVFRTTLEAETDEARKAYLLGGLGASLRYLHQWGDAEHATRLSLSQLEALGDPAATGIGWSNLAVILRSTGREREALQAYERSLELLSGQNPRLAAITLLNQGVLLHHLGQQEASIQKLHSAVELLLRQGDIYHASHAAANLAALQLESGDPDGGLRSFELARTLAERQANPQLERTLWFNLGTALARAGDVATAEKALRRAWSLTRELGDFGAEGSEKYWINLIRLLEGVGKKAEAAQVRDTVESATRRPASA